MNTGHDHSSSTLWSANTVIIPLELNGGETHKNLKIGGGGGGGGNLSSTDKWASKHAEQELGARR